MLEYPASLTVHWPSGPVACCEDHADKLISLGRVMGYHIVATEIESVSECINCKNEADKP